MNVPQIKAEVHNMLKSYSQQGLIDDITLENGITDCLKEFGGNVMQEHAVSLMVKNGRAKLPQNFWALKCAVKCEQEGYHEAKTEKHAQKSISYLEWTEISDYYNYLEGKPCEADCDAKYITETLYFEVPDKSYTFYYNQPTILNLVPHVYEVRCDKDCPNIRAKGEYDVSIDENHKNLTVNFNDGFIWLWYKGLPTDGEGNMIIPMTSRNKVKEYIIYFSVVRVLEQMWLDEGEELQNKIAYFSQQRDMRFYEAKSDTISEGAVGFNTRIVNRNRMFMRKFENMYRNL